MGKSRGLLIILGILTGLWSEALAAFFILALSWTPSHEFVDRVTMVDVTGMFVFFPKRTQFIHDTDSAASSVLQTAGQQEATIAFRGKRKDFDKGIQWQRSIDVRIKLPSALKTLIHDPATQLGGIHHEKHQVFSSAKESSRNIYSLMGIGAVNECFGLEVLGPVFTHGKSFGPLVLGSDVINVLCHFFCFVMTTAPSYYPKRLWHFT
jgi:hypothetical protein